MNVPKYRNPDPIDLPDRRWPSRSLTTSPVWCSVDLRDGNQALPNPLTPDEKLEYFDLLCEIGFKQIEVSFPSASRDDFEFTRRIVDEGRLPDDVFMMVLSQCRPHLVEKTVASLQHAKHGIVHLYCAASELHMTEVFGLDHAGTIDMVVKAVTQTRELVDQMPGSDVRLEFSPEEFTDTDFNFAVELCQAVYDTWGRATPDRPIIFNLPATVERRPPNQYADMIELFCRTFPSRENVLVSLHAHNDQGMAVAATEMALLAGGDRVEGTLFGHGERTGNVDLVILACNLHARGIETGLDVSKLPHIAETVQRLTGMQIYYRQPYAGELVFTAFSGSHQDAIRKGVRKLATAPERFGVGWKVPYLHVDPADLGREVEHLIRINAQSGKGGAAWVLETDYGLQPPKGMHPEIGAAVQVLADSTHQELTGQQVYQVFLDEFINPVGPYELLGYWPRPDDTDPTQIHGEVRIRIHGKDNMVCAEGNGPISAFCHAMHELGAEPFEVADYKEQAVGEGEDARAVAYVPLKFADETVLYGVGTDTNIDQAAVRAIVAGLNRKAARS